MKLLNDPRIRGQIRKKLILGFGLSAIMILVYAVFVLVMVFKPDIFLTVLTAGNPFNVGLLASIFLMVLIMVSMFLYLLLRGNDVHADLHNLITEIDDRNDDPDR